MSVVLQSRRWLGALFGTAIFLSAFLLFGIQPLLSKAILPWFGGSSAVWTTCMLFFQVVLFTGYAYAHLLVARVAPNRQWAIHLVVLAVGGVWLVVGGFGDALAPVLPVSSWKPSAEVDPTWRVVLMLAVTIGWPYFVLSTTGPLLQAWYGRLHPGTVPYRLYALSNAGSLLALLGYPFVVEPRWDLVGQGYGWSGLFVAFVAMTAIVAWSSRRSVEPEEAEEPTAAAGGRRETGAPPVKTLAVICRGGPADIDLPLADGDGDEGVRVAKRGTERKYTSHLHSASVSASATQRRIPASRLSDRWLSCVRRPDLR